MALIRGFTWSNHLIPRSAMVLRHASRCQAATLRGPTGGSLAMRDTSCCLALSDAPRSPKEPRFVQGGSPWFSLFIHVHLGKLNHCWMIQKGAQKKLNRHPIPLHRKLHPPLKSPTVDIDWYWQWSYPYPCLLMMVLQFKFIRPPQKKNWTDSLSIATASWWSNVEISTYPNGREIIWHPHRPCWWIPLMTQTYTMNPPCLLYKSCYTQYLDGFSPPASPLICADASTRSSCSKHRRSRPTESMAWLEIWGWVEFPMKLPSVTGLV